MLDQIISALDGLGVDRGQALRALMSTDDRLSKVKALLGITGTDQDDILLFVVQTAEDQVLKYINHDTLPDPLQNILAVMAVSYYKTAGLGSMETPTGPVSSVKRGDVQTSYATKDSASGAAGTFNLGTENGDFFGWKTVLNEYRKLRW